MSIGEVAIAIGYTHDALYLKNEGYPVVITFPEEGTGYEIASISLIRNGPANERSRARTLFNWALGGSAARIFASHYVVPFHKTSSASESFTIEDVNVVLQNDLWSAANKQRLVEKWNRTIGSGDGN